MHENGKKHKDNVEKFLRNVYHKESENRKEEEKTKKELDRIERAALKQYKKDVILLAPGSSISHIKPPPLPPTTTSNNYNDTIYTQPVKNTEESMIGEWRPVTPPLPSIKKHFH
ncbi:4176_t:CDS:2 [Entrophospora sp. SA101]|nr:3131_t:CDS:2 [Entrophospora sp. SA101]CAJ0858666.1 4176_t:CDS:2 [Entrophospora sp. SA101]CAJ0867696.1 4650_t:CDS:2 [Entrophospora sp. SA101]